METVHILPSSKHSVSGPYSKPDVSSLGNCKQVLG